MTTTQIQSPADCLTITFPAGFGDKPLTIPAPADTSEIAAAVREYLDPDDQLTLGVWVDLDAGVVHIDEQQATIAGADV